MARPKKATVDYFPHMTEHGSTLFILQSRWGNDGYAAWFKTLERMGASDGMFIDCRNIGTWHHLQAYTGVSEVILTEILDTLAQLGKIDKSLWSNKVIYCQRLVDGVTDAFRRRKESIPTRANVFLVCKLAPTEFLTEEIPLDGQKDVGNGINDGRSTERERERERERKEEPSSKPSQMMKRREFVSLYEQTFGKLMPGGLNSDCDQMCAEYTPERIRDAFRSAVDNQANSFAYIRKVITNKQETKAAPPQVDIAVIRAAEIAELRAKGIEI